MGRRTSRDAGWRVLAAVMIVIALVGWLPRGADAASALVVSVTDGAGAPLPGAAFGVFPAVTDAAGVPVIPADATLTGGPVVSGEDGLARLGDLPDGELLGVRQLAVPPGYLADPAGDLFLMTDPAAEVTLTVANAPALVATETLSVSVSGSPDQTGLAGVAISVVTVDPVSGETAVAATATSDAAGQADLLLPPGDYVVRLETPGDWLPAADQPVSLGGADGIPVSVAFGLEPIGQTDPAEPPATETPTAAPTETPAETPTVAPTEAAGPTATAPAESAAPSATTPAEPTATTDPEVGQPATIAVRSIVCTSDDPGIVGTTQINLDADLYATDALPEDCRSAREDEFTFVFRDLRGESPWDDFNLGQRPTDADGYVELTTLTTPAQQVFVFEITSPSAFLSEAFPLIGNQTVRLVAIRVVGPPEGDITVQTIDDVSGQSIAGACYDLAAEGLPDVTLASACDADDGADGVLTFPAAANGRYVLVPTATLAGHVASGHVGLTVDSAPVRVAVRAVPFGAIQLLARSCEAPPAGLSFPTPTPAAGDGIDGLGQPAASGAPDVSDPITVLTVGDGSAVGADGTGLEGDAAANDCVPVGGSVTVTGPDGAVSTVAIDQDGVAMALAVPPTTGDATYTVRDDATGTEVAVTVAPAGTTTVTVLTIGGSAAGAAA